MSQQQGFGTGGGGGGEGDVKSICVSENSFLFSTTLAAPPVCVFPDANGAIGFTADPPIILTALENGLNISFSGSTGGIGFIQGNDSIKVGPDGTQTIQIIGNATQGVSITNTAPNQLTVTIADATSTQKGVVTLGEAGNGIVTINAISPDSSQNFTIDTDTDNTSLFNVVNVPGSNKITLHFHQVDFHPNDENVVKADNDDILIYGFQSTGITTSRFTPQNNGLLIQAYQATPSQRGTLITSDNANTLEGIDLTSAVTPASLYNKLGTQTQNAVVVSDGLGNPFKNSNVGTAGQSLFSNGSSTPNFGSFTSLDSTIAISYNSVTNSLDFRVTGSPPGTPNIEFITGNDNINVPPDPSTHVLKIIGNNTQGVSVTNTGTNELTVTVADATTTQKGVVLLGEVSSGITTINSVLPDSSGNFNITATAPYTVTPGTNSVNIGDNGGIPYQFVPDQGNPVPVTGNSFKLTGNDPIITQVFGTAPSTYYISVKEADYGFFGVNRLAFNEDVLAGTGRQSVTCASLRALMGNLTKYTVLLANDNTHQIQNSSVGTDGQVFFGNTGNFPDFGTLISSSGNITFVYNSTAKTMDVNANVPVDSLPLVVVSSSQPLLTNNAYMFTAGSDSYALPTTSAVNDLLELKVQGASSYTITQADGQSIFLGNTNTTVGTSGSLMCNGPGDWIRLRCTVANTTWVEFGMSAQSFIVN